MAALVLAAAAAAAGPSGAAEFTNSFDAIASGSSVLLTWEGVAPQHLPLCITAQLIERSGEDGYRANAYRANITSTCRVFGFSSPNHPPPLAHVQRVHLSAGCGVLRGQRGCLLRSCRFDVLMANSCVSLTV